MASNSEYEQIRCFNEPISETEKCDLVLNKIIDEHLLNEEFRKSFINSIITGEMRLEIKI